MKGGLAPLWLFIDSSRALFLNALLDFQFITSVEGMEYKSGYLNFRMHQTFLLDGCK